MRQFFVKGVLFAISLAALLLCSEVLVTSTPTWRRYEDPRARILWDGTYDGTRIVLLGDSVFASLYVNSLSETMWARLEAYTGQGVFPGALNGAKPPDILAAALLISQQWPAGTTVFIGVPPTRFVSSRTQEPAMGNFADQYLRQYGIDASDDSIPRRFKGHLYRLLGPLFAYRTRSALANIIDRPQPPPWMRNRVWVEERVAPRERFQFFERNLEIGAPPRPFAWLDRVRQRLEIAGMRPIFVLTPLNEPLVRSFALVQPPDATLHQIRATVAAVRAHLEKSRATVVDLTDSVPSPCFFDLVHPNKCGDDLIAMRLSASFRQHAEYRLTSNYSR
jgi:hypothetical protein